MVRLNSADSVADATSLSMFQFQNGTIKLNISGYFAVRHKRFNSKMVRLNSGLRPQNNVCFRVSIPKWYD